MDPGRNDKHEDGQGDIVFNFTDFYEKTSTMQQDLEEVKSLIAENNRHLASREQEAQDLKKKLDEAEEENRSLKASLNITVKSESLEPNVALQEELQKLKISLAVSEEKVSTTECCLAEQQQNNDLINVKLISCREQQDNCVADLQKEKQKVEKLDYQLRHAKQVHGEKEESWRVQRQALQEDLDTANKSTQEEKGKNAVLEKQLQDVQQELAKFLVTHVTPEPTPIPLENPSGGDDLPEPEPQSDKPKECPICSMSFPPGTSDGVVISHVDQHMETLETEKACPMCDMRFSLDKNDAFQLHVQSHFDN